MKTGLWLLLLTGCCLRAQAVEIESFHSTGEVTWSDSSPKSVWYRIEWTPDPASGEWFRSGQGFGPIQSTSSLPATYTVSVPMAYRVVRSSSLPPSGMVLVDGGPFLMGATNLVYTAPVHEVNISPFYMDRYEVSTEQMRQVMQWAYDDGRVTVTGDVVRSVSVSPADLIELGNDWSHTLYFETGAFHVIEYAAMNDEGQWPMANVTWRGALAYCHFRSLMEGLDSGINIKSFACDFDAPGYRLPTEAEWEKAARGGLVQQLYPWLSPGGHYTNYIDKGKANYDSTILKRRGFYNGGQLPDPGPDMANGYGLYDMAGNLAEWCWDWYQSDWYSDPAATEQDTTGPVGPLSWRVIRGGYYQQAPQYLRCFERAGSVLNGSFVIGFRCVRRP